MKRKYFLVVLFLILSMFFLFNVLNVNATMYKVLDKDGNLIRLTNMPILTVSEKEAGYTLDPPIEELEEENISETQTTTTYQYDFRKVNWGMSKEEVKATEDKKPFSENDTDLYYKNVEIIGRNFFCSYGFIQDKLYESNYNIGTTLGEIHSNKNDYIDDYESVKEILTKKYGKPKRDVVTWKNDLFKNKKQDWGTAISIGHLVYVSTWETPTTEIGVALGGNNYEIWLSVGYDSKELKEWVKKIKEEKAKDKF
ncbi:hypothetical protein ES708_30916 [subsurface metagenome]